MHNFQQTYQYSKDLNILYVEDDFNLQLATVDIFEDYFSSVTTAIDGVDGLEKYIKYRDENSKFYDLIITDIVMPRKDGLGMIKDIMKINPQQVIIVVSAYNDSDKLISLIKEGIANFITKPLMPDPLMQIFHKVSKNIYNEKIKNEFLIGQSKLASMGEMIDTIAHQWLGPINLIKLQTQVLEMEIDEDVIKKESIKEYTDKQFMQINHIVETLNEFRSFFRTSNKLISTNYSEIIESSLILLKDKIRLHNVHVDVTIQESKQIEIIPNEFKHVLINILTNAIDEFKNKDIKNPKISINTYAEDKNVILEIIDNAGGIPEDIIDKIFEANFTTKADSDGTGVGLHLVTLILEKINGKISVKNVDKGANFSISLKNHKI